MTGEESARPSSARVVDLDRARATVLVSLPSDLASDDAINRLTEQLAGLTVSRERLCVHVAGCRPGDGASTVAAAIALDFSQRLGLKTLLVDGHLRHPSLRRLLIRGDGPGAQQSIKPPRRVLPTDWRSLDLAVATGAETVRELTADFDSLLDDYRAAVVDLGVARLDPAVLGFVRNGDPIMLVVRSGYTGRSDLVTTTRMFGAANLPAAAVVLNSVKSYSATESIRRMLRIGA
jgi:Mrp family chromosome partitioning ATPase